MGHRKPQGRAIPQYEATPAETRIAEADRAYFDAHPDVLAFERRAYPLELQQFNFPAGTICRVFRIDSYRQARAFAPPRPEVN